MTLQSRMHLSSYKSRSSYNIIICICSCCPLHGCRCPPGYMLLLAVQAARLLPELWRDVLSLTRHMKQPSHPSMLSCGDRLKLGGHVLRYAAATHNFEATRCLSVGLSRPGTMAMPTALSAEVVACAYVGRASISTSGLGLVNIPSVSFRCVVMWSFFTRWIAEVQRSFVHRASSRATFTTSAPRTTGTSCHSPSILHCRPSISVRSSVRPPLSVCAPNRSCSGSRSASEPSVG